ncbi:hypothetical protein GGF46_005442 [Coemansia sp. RSA 552]|nr:hypothetical protein GGF46_005442 [Coemansia sp. RSA 552]
MGGSLEGGKIGEFLKYDPWSTGTKEDKRETSSAGRPQTTSRPGIEGGSRAAPTGKDLARNRIQDQISRRKEAVRKTAPSGAMQRAPRDENIKASMISLISETGSQEGVHPLQRVLAGLDRSQHTLVMVAPDSSPPVCRVFSRKLLYEREKKARKARVAAAKGSKEKIIKVNENITDHDMLIKLNRLREMLEKGYRVSIMIQRSNNRGIKYKGVMDRRVEEFISHAPDVSTLLGRPERSSLGCTIYLQGRAPPVTRAS